MENQSIPKVSKKEVEKALEGGKFHCDKLIAKKNGIFIAKRSFFYRCGLDAEQFADAISEALKKGLGFRPWAVVGIENWKAWPKTSYFEAHIRLNAQDGFKRE